MNFTIPILNNEIQLNSALFKFWSIIQMSNRITDSMNSVKQIP